MLPHQLDAIFPYVCFAYGVMMTIALGSKTLARIADEMVNRAGADSWVEASITRMRAHRVLALFCLWVGAFWILQNLWLA